MKNEEIELCFTWSRDRYLCICIYLHWTTLIYIYILIIFASTGSTTMGRLLFCATTTGSSILFCAPKGSITNGRWLFVTLKGVVQPCTTGDILWNVSIREESCIAYENILVQHETPTTFGKLIYRQKLDTLV